jgi:hypothetical protein
VVHHEVPPDVTTGRCVVVLGAGGLEVCSWAEPGERSLLNVLSLDAEESPDEVGDVGFAVVDPGSSLATTTPISAVVPVAARTASRVTRRTRTSVRCRFSGEGFST